MENNNGRGIFYGVIGVATLVVAIIGATFAYFSASITRNNAITNVGSTTLSLDIIQEQSNFKADMIPVDADNEFFGRYPGLAAEKCKDDSGNSICSVYQFTISNPNETTAQTVIGRLEVTENTGFKNLSYTVFKGAASSITTYDINGTADDVEDLSAGGVVVARQKFGDVGDKHDWDFTEEELAANGGSQTYTVVVWLEEAGEDNNDEQGKMFSAKIIFDTNTGAGGVTGVLSAAS